MNVDLLIHAACVLRVEPAEPLLQHSVAVDNGKVIDILPTDKANSRYQASHVEHCDQHILMPGFVNAHTHVAMNLLRGIADDLPLQRWLTDHIWPAEAKWLSESFVHDGSQHAIAEMLRSGTTCFNDMYLYPDITARVAQQAGIRAQIGIVVIDFPTAWAKDADEYLHKGLAVFDEFKGDSRISLSLAPHAPYTVSEEPLRRVATLSNELGLKIHIHLHETAQEVEDSVESRGVRGIEHLSNCGLLGPDLNAVHMTQLTQEEIKRLAIENASVIHCPSSNMKLASGFCPTSDLLTAGVNVALGTDGAASNNDLDMFSEMRIAAMIAKGHSGDATALPANDVLRMATINGARALGLDDTTGSISKGKAADLIAVRIDNIETTPVYDPASQIVYACGRENVEHVWVAGKPLLHHRSLTTLDEKALIKSARHWQHRIAASDAAHQNTEK